MSSDEERLKALFQQTTTWRYYAKDMYSYCQTQMVEWPSLSVDWMPDRKRLMPGCEYSFQYLAVSTQALPGSVNSVQVLEFAVPLEQEDLDNFYGGDKAIESEDPTAKFNNVKGHVATNQLINVEAQVLKIRTMPQDTDVMAIAMSNGAYTIFDTSQRPMGPTDGGSMRPDCRLKGHRRPGFGLEWNPNKTGTIASGGDDQLVIVWDCLGPIEDPEKYEASREDIQPIATYVGHTDVVHDVAWHGTHDNVLASVSGDASLKLWDMREADAAIDVPNAHGGCTYSVDFHPFSPFLLATGGADHVVNMWDMRKMDKPCHQLLYHSNEVINVQWAPFADTVLASSGMDRRVVMWDTQKMGMMPTHEDDEYAPPELSFIHSGLLSRVTDMRWCPSLEDEWLMAAADMTNVLHIFRPRRDLLYDYVAPDVFDLDASEEQKEKNRLAVAEAHAREKEHDERLRKEADDAREADRVRIANEEAEREAAFQAEKAAQGQADEEDEEDEEDESEEESD